MENAHKEDQYRLPDIIIPMSHGHMLTVELCLWANGLDMLDFWLVTLKLKNFSCLSEHENSKGDQLANDAKTCEEESPQNFNSEIRKDKKHGEHIDLKEETPHEEPAMSNKKKKKIAAIKSINAAVSDVQTKDKHKRG